MELVAITLVGLGGIAGTLWAARIGTRTALASVGLQIAAADRRRQEEAAMDLLAAAHLSYIALRELPAAEAGGSLDRLSEVVETIGDVIPGGRTHRYLQTRARERKYFGDDLRAPMRDLVRAAARLQVLTNDELLRKASDSLLDYLEDFAENRSPAQAERWPEVRDELSSAIQAFRSTPLVPRSDA